MSARAGRVTWIKYIIFDRRIWSASTGWAQRQYNGSNPHDKHLHVSCKPDTASENTTRPLGLRNLVEDDMPLSDADVDKVAAEVIRRLDTAPIRNNRTLGGTLNALASGDGADNPIARAVWAREFGDPEQPPNPDGTEKVRTTGYWQRFTHQEIHNLGRVLTRMDAREAAEVPPTATQNARAVVEALAADTPERTAAALRVALGPRAAAVGRLLAEDFAAAASHAAEHSGPPTTR